MKKSFFLATAMLLIAFSESVAQSSKKTSWDFLKGQKELNVVFDYSDLKIENQAESVYFAYKGEKWATKWENGKTEFFSKFVGEANGKSKSIVLGNTPNAEFTATVKILSLDDDWDMKVVVIFTKTNDNNVLATKTIKGSAGTFGSATNLTGDAMLSTGRKFGKFISKKGRN